MRLDILLVLNDFCEPLINYFKLFSTNCCFNETGKRLKFIILFSRSQGCESCIICVSDIWEACITRVTDTSESCITSVHETGEACITCVMTPMKHVTGIHDIGKVCFFVILLVCEA
jgi:hypothetical protein